MKVFIFTWIVLCFKSISAREEWIDPHDMYIRTDSSTQRASTIGNGNNDQVCIERSASYLKKAIGVIVNVVKYEENIGKYTGQLKIEINKEEYDFLKIFISSGEVDDSSLRRVDMILDNSLQNSKLNAYVMKISEYIYFTVFNEQTLKYFILILSICLLWKMQPQNYTIKSLFKLFLLLLYISDFLLRYFALLEEVEIDRYLEFKNQNNCELKTLGWIDWSFAKITGYCEKAEKRYLMSQRAALHIITPLKVFSEQFSLVVPILKYSGQGFGQFMWALIEEVPWYVKPCVSILAFILVAIIILMLGAYILGITPKFNIFHIFKVELLHKEHVSIERQQHDSISGDNLRLLLESKNNRVDANRSNSTHQIKHENAFTFKTKKAKEPTRRKLHRIENKNTKFKAIEEDRSLGIVSGSSSSIKID